MFEYTYQPRYGDYKNFDEIRVGSVLDFIQDISIRDSERCGFSLDKMRSLNLAWLLQGINLRFKSPVKTGAAVDVATGVKTHRGAISDRCCILRQDGEIVAESVSRWFIFDTIRQRPCKIPADMLGAYELYNFEEDFFNYKKVDAPEPGQPIYKVRVSNQDIDTNMHLNNRKSSEMLMDALPYDFRFTDLSIQFHKPAFLHDILKVCFADIENGYSVHLLSDDNSVCVAGTFKYNEND